MESDAPARDTEKPPRAAPGLKARTVALNLFEQVKKNRMPLDEAIEASHAWHDLEARDRAFVRMLLASTFRRIGQIDLLIRHCLDRPLPRSAATVRNILRLGVAQIVVLKTPPHAVVDTAVRLCGQSRHPGQKGLVNAVLRRLTREGPAMYDTQDAPRLNTPDWLWQSWTNAYGEETCRRIAAVHLAEAPTDLTVKRDPVGWAERLDAVRLPTGTLRLRETRDIATLPGYEEGDWWVQDAAAALPAKVLLSMLGKDTVRSTIADLCAAPGGKTAQLAAAGARVIAVDRSKRRLATLRENLKRLRLQAEIVASDAATWRPAVAPDAILLDAPCSATGTVRRHPDVPGNKTPAEIERLAGIQKALIATAADILKPGGTLVYSVCSLQPEEGEHVVEAMLQSRGDLHRLQISASETGAPPETITPKGDLRTLPCHFADFGGMDGFYIARLRKSG